MCGLAPRPSHFLHPHPDEKRDPCTTITIALADDADRSAIYRMRHQVYGLELGQHPTNSDERLSDALDGYNLYLKACVGGDIVGFISITPPGQRYSVDKYFERDGFPFPFDAGLHEVRLLTVAPVHRRLAVASLLMYAALRWIEGQGGTRVVAIGRHEVLSLYRKAGLQPLGRCAQSGAVTYDLLSATVRELRQNADRRCDILRWLERRVRWRLYVPFRPANACHHGGEFFEAVGENFDHLERKEDIINADVLDAWFPPSPHVISALQQHLPWLIRTSPPTGCAGMIRAIARSRRIPAECIVPAAGSSELIFLAFRAWFDRTSRILLLDPTYGEYGHLAERIVRCCVDRIPLVREENYQLRPAALEAALGMAVYDLVVIVNPNSPTGQHVPRLVLESVLHHVPARTRVWVDETYVEYTGPDQSLEAFAARGQNVIVCKSMSKIYALSGLRAAYLCAPPAIAQSLREITPPWAVSLLAQIAAVKAMEDPGYYAARYGETQSLRQTLAESLRSLGLDVVPGVANFLLCHLPGESADAATVARRCRERGLYVRDAGDISPRLGTRALRIAVKDDQTNRRMVQILKSAL